MQKKRPDAKVFFVTLKTSLTLLDALITYLPQLKSPIKCIHAGGVWSENKRLTNPGTVLKSKTRLKVYVCPTQGVAYYFSKESIIKESDDWVVVMKEPLVTIGMDRSNMYFNLMAGLNHYYGFKNLQSGVQPITRLDYRVSGLCLFSKHKSAEQRLFMQMQQRRIKKRYLAVVHDREVICQRVTVDHPLTYKQKAMISQDGKPAKTRFILTSGYLNGCHVYQAITKTGRRHQVRVHAATAIGPLINDELYGKQSGDRHRTIGLIANHLQFYWNGKWERVQLSYKWEQQALTWLGLGGG